jgi:hypothetical protein
MKDMHLLKFEYENEEEVLSFQSPALADIAFGVSTPVQVNSIMEALVVCLEPSLFYDFRIPLVLADLKINSASKNQKGSISSVKDTLHYQIKVVDHCGVV